MKNKKLMIVAGIFLVLLLVCIGAIYKYFAPSNVKREMSKQYKIEQGQYLLVINDTVMQERGVASEGQPYIPVDLAIEYFNHRFYWDSMENILSYATPDEVYTIPLGTKDYTVGRQTQTAKYNILVQQGEQVYINMEFLKENSATCQYKVYENPNRIVAVGDFTNQYSFGKLKKSTRLRVGPNKKYDYLVEMEKEAQVFLYPDERVENEYVKVMTMDGIEGYIPMDSFSSKEEKAFSTDRKEPQYEHQNIGKTVNLAWHQVTNLATNSYLSTTLANTKGLNVVSPTWFAVSDNKGNLSSLASEEYVQTAHAKGLQVWALVNDFDKNVSMTKVLGKTSSRQQLINNLVSKAIQYNVDGINIDFERITKDSAAAYLEFLRELVIKCKSNHLILSTDNYVPAGHNAHYDLEEQGKVVDYVIIMAYDEHYAGCEESGSVSSISFVKDGVTNTLAKVNKEQLVVALPFYTRLWKEVKKSGGSVSVTSQAYGMNGAENVLKQNGAMAKWDDTTGQYYSEFKSGKAKFKIWLEEEKSLEEKLKVVTKENVAGVAFWKLGFERADVWDTISKYIK